MTIPKAQPVGEADELQHSTTWNGSTHFPYSSLGMDMRDCVVPVAIQPVLVREAVGK
jgi:hypothetical protein